MTLALRYPSFPPLSTTAEDPPLSGSTALARHSPLAQLPHAEEPDGATSCAVRCDGRVTHRACAPRPRTHARRDARVRRTYQRCADPLACLAPEDAPCSLLVCRLPARFCWCLLATVACCDRRCQGVATFLRSHSIGRIALETRVVSALSPAAAVHAALRLPPLCDSVSTLSRRSSMAALFALWLALCCLGSGPALTLP
jgi:hypothetical protein